MHYCNISIYKDLVDSWDAYYPKPQDKVRMGLVLKNPELVITNRSAIAHDFYYFGDEFSVIFDPLQDQDKVFMLVEGPHFNPLGQRIPILSTWSHLKRAQHGETGIQEAFAFYDNKWWTISEWTYD